MTYEFLQHYWFFLIALLGGLLVFMMFVQGANAAIFALGKTEAQRKLMMNSTGRKWELTFTTLVLFGGAFFASFPLFYSTSFGGAYWVWILLLFTFVFQAVSYEFQNKKGNLLGSKTFRTFLMLNGILAPVIVGAAVGTFFTGSDFTVNKAVMLGEGSGAISAWGSGWHGLEALTQPLCLFLGVMIFALDAVLGGLYMLGNIREADLEKSIRKYIRIFSLVFLITFVGFAAILLTKKGFAVAPDGTVSMESFKYLHNLLQMPAVLIMLLVGAVLVLVGFYFGGFTKSDKGIWFSGVGTVLAVISVFLLAGYNGTAYYPSYADLQSSLSIANSSSSLFTLKMMFYVSLVIPFVLAYIIYVWYVMDKKPLTDEEMNRTPEKY